jgi:hypothetical protein
MSLFLYHQIPDDFRGQTIYSLNQLQSVYPDLYKEKISKYAWRPEIMEQPVYPLDCVWNDCIFMVAVPPWIIKQKLHEVSPATKFPHRFWQIDPGQLEARKATIYTFEHATRPHPPADFVPYDPDSLGQWSTIPDKTTDYWRQCIDEQNSRLLLYMYIPHILYRGSIDISAAKIIEV